MQTTYALRLLVFAGLGSLIGASSFADAVGGYGVVNTELMGLVSPFGRDVTANR